MTTPAGGLRHGPIAPRGFWGDTLAMLGVGYFLAYMPYGFLLKASTDGLLPGVPKVSGFFLLPASVLATFACTFLGVTLFGWWRHVARRTIAGVSIPVPRPQAIWSGLGTAVIIGTTSLAYSVPGVSIVLMMVLMRGGVLTIGHLTDIVHRRHVHWRARLGWILTVIAVSIGLFGLQDMALGAAAACVIGVYLIGYVVRFQVIQRLSKTADRHANFRYVVEELMIAMPALLLTVALMTVVGPAAVQHDVRAGFELLVTGGARLWTALLVGVSYAVLYMFGTLIYLHPREYTFCVPVNRASSILSGVVVSVAIAFLFRQPLPSAAQFAGAALLLVALLTMALPEVGPLLVRRGGMAADRLILFVCAGNTARSPIAQALCAAAIAERLKVSRHDLAALGITIASAGVTARVGKPMKPEAVEVLEAMGVEPHRHEAQQLTPGLIARATAIYCMTADQVRQALEIGPGAAAKIHCLSPQGDLEEPVGTPATQGFADRAHAAIQVRLGELLRQLEPAMAPASSQ